MGERYANYPIDQIQESMQRAIDRGAETHMKYTCSGCGDRVTVTAPDVLFETVQHIDCGVITDIRKVGCNFMFILPIGRN